jgi:hypothetical protein
MQPCIDEFGNSEVERALEMIKAQRAIWKKSLKPQEYQLRISQGPINIEEAFATRELSIFPVHLTQKQLQRINDKTYPTSYVDLYRDDQGTVQSKISRKQPIDEFPINPRSENKEGVVIIYEPPIKNLPFSAYLASVDPVSEGKTTTSDSLCSIYIYRTSLEVTLHKADGSTEQQINEGKVVACWCGRFDDLDKTHERLELLIEYYNAWTLVENNVSLFIRHMIARKKQKYLVPKNQIAFLKEASSNSNVYQEYGWKNTGVLFSEHMLSYAIQFVNEEIGHETKPDGEIMKTIYGVERIPDKMLLTEMNQYRKGLNVDRLVAFCALVSFVKLQDSVKGYSRKTEYEKEQPKQNSSKLIVSPFRHIGGRGGSLKDSMRKPSTPFKNFN